MAFASITLALAVGLFFVLLFFSEEGTRGTNGQRLAPIRVRSNTRSKRQAPAAPEMEEDGLQIHSLEWIMLAVFILIVFSFIALQL
jgi:hypothetical protein